VPGPLGPLGSAEGSAKAESGRSTSSAFSQLKPGMAAVGDGRALGDRSSAGVALGAPVGDAAAGRGVAG
jgi:hypothetical protein